MNLNGTSPLDYTLFPPYDLEKEFGNLFIKYQKIQSLCEDKNQEIYTLKKNLQTATAAESYLSEEIEFIENNQQKEIEKAEEKYLLEIQKLKDNCMRFKNENDDLEKQIDDLGKENGVLKTEIKKLKKKSEDLKNITLNDNKKLQQISELEKENFELLAKVKKMHQKEQESIMLLAEGQWQIADLKEEILCLTENLKAKLEELEEKMNILESTQERMMEMNAELAGQKFQPQNENRKDNSLFAEVDDQRRAMMKTLSEHKESYLQMKKIYNESKSEIRRLKRENVEMHKEFQSCTTIFLNSDKTFIDKLNKRITQLLEQNKDLEHKLNRTQDKLIDLSYDKGINRVDSMLKYSRNETKGLQIQLHNCRIEKGMVDSELRNCQQEMVKWRFEALRSRCVIIDRECLLEENGIEFKDIAALKIHISQDELERATVKITSKVIEANSCNNHANGCNEEHETLNKLEQNIQNDNSNCPTEISTNSGELLNKLGTHKICMNKVENANNCFETEKNLELPHRVDKNVKLETDAKADIKQENTPSHIPFEIYEDKVDQIPTIKCSKPKEAAPGKAPFNKISIENTSRKLKVLEHDFNKDRMSQIDSKNKTELKESTLPPGENYFQIYEDTTNHVPVVRMSGTRGKYLVNNDPHQMENSSSVANGSFENDSSHTKELNSATEHEVSAGVLRSIRLDTNIKKDEEDNLKPKCSKNGPPKLHI